ncbi:MAG: hypothetical protein R3A44_26415 [Caldilineaceae bacterium]
MKSQRDLVLAVTAGHMVLLGLWVAFIAAGWAGKVLWFMPLLSAASLAVLLITLWARRRWRAKSPSPHVQHRFAANDMRPENPAPANSAVIELANLRYEIFDADEPALFADFLDQPLLVKVGAQPGGYDTPGQVIENAIWSYVQQLEAACRGQVTANLRIARGSLTISLAFLSVYGFLAQYHDFVESLTMLRRQMQGLMRQVNSWYLMESGRELRVRSDIQLKSPAEARQQVAKAAIKDAAVGDGFPLGITTTVTPAHNDIRIHVANSGLISWLLALLLGVSVVIQILIGVIYVTCLRDVSTTSCTELLGQILKWFGDFVHQLY